MTRIISKNIVLIYSRRVRFFGREISRENGSCRSRLLSRVMKFKSLSCRLLMHIAALSSEFSLAARSAVAARDPGCFDKWTALSLDHCLQRTVNSVSALNWKLLTSTSNSDSWGFRCCRPLGLSPAIRSSRKSRLGGMKSGKNGGVLCISPVIFVAFVARLFPGSIRLPQSITINSLPNL